jgi:hypothetical protein
MAKELRSPKAEHHILDVRQLDRLDGAIIKARVPA